MENTEITKEQIAAAMGISVEELEMVTKAVKTAKKIKEAPSKAKKKLKKLEKNGKEKIQKGAKAVDKAALKAQWKVASGLHQTGKNIQQGVNDTASFVGFKVGEKVQAAKNFGEDVKLQAEVTKDSVVKGAKIALKTTAEAAKTVGKGAAAVGKGAVTVAAVGGYAAYKGAEAVAKGTVAGVQAVGAGIEMGAKAAKDAHLVAELAIRKAARQAKNNAKEYVQSSFRATKYNVDQKLTSAREAVVNGAYTIQANVENFGKAVQQKASDFVKAVDKSILKAQWSLSRNLHDVGNMAKSSLRQALDGIKKGVGQAKENFQQGLANVLGKASGALDKGSNVLAEAAMKVAPQPKMM